MWLDLLYDIFKVCIIPLLGVATTYLIAFISKKSKQLQDKIDNDQVDRYIEMLENTITTCVVVTNQTYVEALKKQDKFDAEAQKQAFQMTYKAVQDSLTESGVAVLEQITNDIPAYITQLIEKKVNENK